MLYFEAHNTYLDQVWYAKLRYTVLYYTMLLYSIFFNTILHTSLPYVKV